jgi:uncharacterized protein
VVSDAVVHRPESRRFELDLGADGVAHVLYESVGDDLLDLRHTIVPEAAQGRGVGTTLIDGVFEIARRDGIRVIPSCPFVAAWLDDHPEGADVVGG